tara:strand:+ start:251 stop:1909 length:1659 start_codon:yes stop_codon:yes gene_type:complete
MANSQNFVSTNPENKNVILEEFTGISCGFCPDGHSIAQGIKNNHPNDFAVIAIHAGSFSSPQGAGTDFRTTAGSAIDGYFAPSGYPNGTVNRVGGSMSRGSWASASSTILSQSSPVNVGVQASVDMATNILTVNVEVYYTGSQTATSNKLSIAVVQNNVEGPQSGSSGNTSSVLPNGNYNHQHMLRHMMTGTWGEQISDVSVGSLYTNEYTWTMPANINGVTLDPTNLGIVAFVAENNIGILSGTVEVAPEIVFVNTEDVFSTEGIATDLTCNSLNTTDLSLTFKNYGTNILTSVNIDYSINGGPTNTYPWTGSLASAGIETVIIPNTAVTASLTNSVTFTLSSPNGIVDQNPANNTSSATFNGLSSATNGQASIDITTDNYGSETTWNLKEGSTTIASGGPYANSAAAQATVYATLDASSCYTFTILDSYGDGMNSGFGVGSFTITDDNGTVIANGGTFTTEEVVRFQTNGSSTNINETISNLSVYPNPASDKLTISGIYKSVDILDIYGKVVLSSNAKQTINVSSLASGIYMLNIHTENRIKTQKITITK